MYVHDTLRRFDCNFNSYSRKFLSETTYSLPTDSKHRSLIDPKATISSDSIVGESTRVEERTSIKKSVIGKHCVIGKMVKITGCVVLDHCVIADGYVSRIMLGVQLSCQMLQC